MISAPMRENVDRPLRSPRCFGWPVARVESLTGLVDGIEILERPITDRLAKTFRW